MREVDDQRQPGERERERDPDPPAHLLVEDVARPERDEERPEVLDQQRDPDREPVDREEVEPLHEGEAADAEHREERQLAGADAEARPRGQGQHEREADERPGRAHLREPERREARRQDHLRDRAVDRPQDRGGRSHRVAQPWASNGRRPDREGRLAHRASLRPTLTHDRDVAQPG